MSGFDKVIFVLGDIHGDMARLNYLINKQIRMNSRMRRLAEENEIEVMILQCGDFAFFWPGDDNSAAIKNKVDFLKDGLVKIYWCAGNHEDHDKLDSLFAFDSCEGFAEVAQGVFFARFGAVLDVGAIRVLFAGGAESHDKEYRKEGKDWWPQEGISESDLERLPDGKVDWVISHTAPWYFEMPVAHGALPEQSRAKLDVVFDRYQPQNWFFGHFHQYRQGYYDGCDWTCLNYMGGGGRSWERICL